MNTRLKQFLAAENITQAQFADTIQVVRASVSHVLSGRNNPSYDFIRAIMDKYPRLNMEWLMFGKGKMYKTLADDTPEIPEIPKIQESGNLFTEEFYDDPSAMSEEKQATIETNTLADVMQSPVVQRKVSKVVILYDDGSYQEIY